jgi:hypothetical protein
MNAPIETKLLNKAIEAFMVAVEIYNKPTIRYRVEGFSFFICNAWELMLKSHLIKTEGSIYHKDNPHRTISLENCVKLVFTNSKSPLRLNLEKIIELRNTSTHFITEEYEMVYVPLFQSCIFNFVNKINAFHGVDMSQYIPQNFLTLSVVAVPFDENEIHAKYPREIAQRLLSANRSISKIAQNGGADFSISIVHDYYLTKDKNAATAIVRIDPSATDNIRIVKEIRDPNLTHNFSAKKCYKEITRRLKSSGIDMEFNSYHFDLFCKYYKIKENDNFCFVNRIHAHPTFSYSIRAIEFVVDEFCKDPGQIIENIKKSLKKANPRGKGILGP